MHGEHGTVCIPIHPGQIYLDDQKNEGDTAPRWLKEDVKGDAVHNEWRDQDKSQRDKTVRQEQHPDNGLRSEDQWKHVTRLHKRTEKRDRPFRQGRRRLRQEVEKAIEAEDEKGEAHQYPRNGGKKASD